MTTTRIQHITLPDPAGPVTVTTNDGQPIGTLTFEKGTSRLEYAPGQTPHRAYPLKKKHRAR